MLGSQTAVVNGQRFDVPTWAQWNPQGWGPQSSGVPQVSPSMPPFLGGGAAASAGMESVAGYSTAGSNAINAQAAAAHPWSVKLSPVWWAVIGLLGSLLLLRAVHWRDTMLEGKESARVGGASEAAEAAA